MTNKGDAVKFWIAMSALIAAVGVGTYWLAAEAAPLVVEFVSGLARWVP